MFSKTSKIAPLLALVVALGATAGPASASMLDGTSPSQLPPVVHAKVVGPGTHTQPARPLGALQDRMTVNHDRGQSVATITVLRPDDRADRGIPATKIELSKPVATDSASSSIDSTSVAIGLGLFALLGGLVMVARRQTRAPLAS